MKNKSFSVPASVCTGSNSEGRVIAATFSSFFAVAVPGKACICSSNLIHVTTASFPGRRRHSCIEPGLKFATTGGDRARELIQFQTKYRHHFAIIKLVQIIEGEAAALWLRCSRNPNRQLFRFELLNLFRRL